MWITLPIYALLIYLAFAAGYQLVFSAAGLFRPRRMPAKDKIQRKFAVLIPAYREDRVIAETAKKALEQDYPQELFEVIVIADQLQPETLARMGQLPIRILQVAMDQSTKSKALNLALKALPASYDAVVILDADNWMEPGFLKTINAAMQAGYQAVQGRRVAKNLDTPLAILDGASEDINNQIYGTGQRMLGFSARLAGSGMAFDYALFTEIMSTVNAIGGFDKELELKLTQRGIRIEYEPNARVLDEKVRQSSQFAKQRGRWIAAQFHYAGRFLPKAALALVVKGNADFFNKALQMILPPRLFTPALLFLGFLAGLLVSLPLALFSGAWFAASVLAFLLAFPRHLYRRPYRAALWRIPYVLWLQIASMKYWRKALKRFLHTAHDSDSNTSKSK